MEDGKVDACVERCRSVTFDWKIDNFLTDLKSGSRICSFTFQIYGYDCWLDVKLTDNSNCVFSLCKRVTWNTKLFPASCSLDVIDRQGMSFLKTNGEIQDDNQDILIVIDEDVFIAMKERLITRGILTVLFSWFEKNCSDGQTESDEGPTKFLKTLSKDLGYFYESKMDTDCVLKVGERQFPVHRAVLSARSNVFAAMFHHDTLESQKGEVDIQGVDASALNDVIYFIYTGEIRGLSPDTAAPMYIVSDKYALIEIRDVCLAFLMDNLTVGNICSAAVLAHTHGETALEYRVVQFIKDNFENLVNNDYWNSFVETNPALAYKFTSKALLACKIVKNEESGKVFTESESFVSEDLFIEDF